MGAGILIFFKYFHKVAWYSNHHQHFGTHLDDLGSDVVGLDRPAAPNPFGEIQSVKPCDHNLRQAILLAERMIKLADDGDDDREDTGCGILYGMLRDSGYKIKQLAEAEKLNHIAKGWWDKSC
jgi:hypothetical protein